MVGGGLVALRVVYHCVKTDNRVMISLHNSFVVVCTFYPVGVVLFYFRYSTFLGLQM